MDRVYNKCRLCLKLGEFSSIFELDDAVKLSDMVMSFANIKISENDGLPDRVCNTCIENLSTAYLFKLQCERIDSLIRQPQENEDCKRFSANSKEYKKVINRDLYMHTDYNNRVKGENDQNSLKDCNEAFLKHERNYETSDETDSDFDSIKCVYCNESYGSIGAHTCYVTCTIENNEMQMTSSSETLVAADSTLPFLSAETTYASAVDTNVIEVPCVLCDEKFTDYSAYEDHINKCTANVKLHYFVCPICHDIFGDKINYLEHLKTKHFMIKSDPGTDDVDFAPFMEKTRKPKAVRRQIGWSVEDIYQEIECKKVETEAPMPSPIKNFFSKLGNESFSRQSTPKRVSFRKFIEDGKAKTSNYIQKFKKKSDAYSPLKGKVQTVMKVRASLPEVVSDSDYTSAGGTSDDSWKMKQNLICACDKKVFMLSEALQDRQRISYMITELGGVVAENTKMEMLASHFISALPNDTYTGMMVCALATGKWLLHVNYVYDSFRGKRFLKENVYEWKKHPKILELDGTSVEVAKAAVFWHLELQALNARMPFEGKQVVLIMKKKYRQYYHMIFKALKAKPITYDPRTPGSCCAVDYCFVDMKVIERVKLRFFARHNVPVYPYQFILIYLLRKGKVEDEHKYLVQDNKKYALDESLDCFNSTM